MKRGAKKKEQSHSFVTLNHCGISLHTMANNNIQRYGEIYLYITFSIIIYLTIEHLINEAVSIYVYYFIINISIELRLAQQLGIVFPIVDLHYLLKVYTTTP